MTSAIAGLRFEKRSSDVGVYWTSKASKRELRSYMQDLATTHYKAASIGGDQEQGFEQSFSSLAYSYLKDKAPRLLDFIIGFQLVDRNEDNTKAMGIFGFKVGEQWLYAPVFFLNGDMKGHELLYIKKQDAFVPLKENWVNYLISRRPHVLGEGSAQNTHELGGMMPNLSRLSRSPTSSKYGSDAWEPNIAEWARPALPLMMALATKKAAALYSTVKTSADLEFCAVVEQPIKAAFAAEAEKFDLRSVLAHEPRLLPLVEKLASAYPPVRSGLDRFYGADFLSGMRMYSEAAALVKQADSYILPPKGAKLLNGGRTRKAGSRYLFDDEKTPTRDKNAELTIFALDVDADYVITDNKPELTDAERERLLKDTVLIRDKRDSHGTSIAYNTQVRLELTNPQDTGLYQVLEKPGNFDEMLVITNPHSGRGRENFCLVVRKSDPRSWLNTHRSNLWAKKLEEMTEFRKWVEGLSSVSDCKKNGVYIAIHENGSATCPFEIREDYGDGAYRVSWKDHTSWRDRSGLLPKLHNSSSGPFSDRDDYDSDYNSWDAKVYINKRKGTGLRSVNGELTIPDTYKIIEVQPPPKPKKDKDSLVSHCCGEAPDDGGSAKTPITPGNLVDVQLMLHKEAQVIKLHDTGANEIWIRSPRGHERMTKKAALLSLVRDHGLREDAAREMLKAAEAVHGLGRASASFFIKYAYGYGSSSLQPGPDAPAIPEPMYGTEQMGPNSVQSIYPQEEEQSVPGMDSSQTDPGIYDPFYQPDQKAMQTAQQASLSGQKEVFDTSMVSGMLKAVRQDSLVDRYLGDLMKALDKLGRILFMFYWHQEEFEDRYGKQDLPELEDTLRNAFEILGDVSLFLKEKTVQGQHGVEMGGGGVGSQAEPNIEEAARN